MKEFHAETFHDIRPLKCESTQLRNGGLNYKVQKNIEGRL